MQLPRLRTAILSMLLRALAMLLALLLFFVARRFFFPGRQPTTPANVPPLPTQAQAPAQFAPAETRKSNPGKRILIGVSALALITLIVGGFLFSVRSYSGTLAQAKTSPARATQAVLVRPAFERGIIYPQWSQNGYGAQDTVWQQDIATMKKQTAAQWI